MLFPIFGQVIIMHLVNSVLISSNSINDSFNERHLQASVCKYNTFDCRNRSTSKPPPGYESCCQQCVCSDDCVAGNCCPNSAINPFMKAPCKSQLSIFGKHPYLWQVIEKLQFYTIDTCPEDSDAVLKSACNDPQDIQDYNLVSDAKYNNIFKNEKCAFCNGITSIKRWYQGLVIDDSTNETEVHRLIRANKLRELKQIVQFFSYPPTDFPAYLYLCRIDTIDKCNVSGAWDEYNETIVSLCEHPLLTSSYKPLSRSYKNVYCLRCNSKKTETIPSMCLDTGLSKGLIRNGQHYYRMIMLLQPDLPNEDDDLLDTSLNCLRDEVLDPWTEECIVLNCPVGTSPYFGQCQKNKYRTDGKVVTIVLELTIVNSSRSEWLDYAMVKQFVESVVTQHDCRLCVWQLWAHNDDMRDCYYLRITLYTGDKCNEANIIDNYYSLLYGENNALSFSQYTVKIALNGIEIFDQLENLTIIFRQIYMRCLSSAFVVGSKFYCPSITFNITTLDQYLVSPKHREMLISRSELMRRPRGNKELYSVCLSDYRKPAKETIWWSVITSETMIYLSQACTCILSCLSVTTALVNFRNPDIPRALKFVVPLMCLDIVFGRVFNEVLLNVSVLHKTTNLILRQTIGTFCSLLIPIVNVKILLATHKIGTNQADLVSFYSRVRKCFAFSLCLCFGIALCEGLYLFACVFMFVDATQTNNILAHNVACLLPLNVLIVIGLTLICKPLKNNTKDELYSISVSKSLLIVSLFSVFVEIVRTVNDFTQTPEWSIISSAVSIPYGITIIFCFTFRLQRTIISHVTGNNNKHEQLPAPNR